MLIIGIAYYNAQVSTVRSENLSMLSAIADLKIMQITQWRQERVRDAQQLARDRDVLQYCLDAISGSGSIAPAISTELRQIIKVHGYRNILVYDRDGRQRYSALPGAWSARCSGSESSLQLMDPRWGDFARDPASGEIYLDLLVPLGLGGSRLRPA